MRRIKKAMLMGDNSDSPMIAEFKSLLEKNKFYEDDIAFFLERLVSLLDDYTRELGENTEVRYFFQKRLSRIEARLSIPGEAYDPFENGAGAKTRKIEKSLNLNLNTEKVDITYHYVAERNVITASIPLSEKKKSILKNPIIWAVLLGVVVGVVCLHLPQNTNSFIINDLLTPVQDVVLKVLSGIMGPVIFISLVSSIIALDSINDLTDLGLKIFRRFLLIILFTIVVSIGVSLVFFADFGEGGFDFEPSQIITMLLNIIPTNLFKPFVENNTPQLVVLAFVTGIALLIISDSVKELKSILQQINQWTMNIMKIIMKLLPALPFLSIALVIAKGNVMELLEGWKFIVASYIVFTILFVFKLFKVSARTKIPIKEIMHKTMPLMTLSFTAGSQNAAISQTYEVAEKDFGIKPEFVSFWIPMSTAMLGIKTTVNLVLATMMASHLCGIPISYSFLFVLTILVLELSLASPGSTAGWVIMFDSFSIPSSYTGLFSTYRMFTDHYTSAAATGFSMLEQLEAAYRMNELKQSPSDFPIANEEGV